MDNVYVPLGVHRIRSDDLPSGHLQQAKHFLRCEAKGMLDRLADSGLLDAAGMKEADIQTACATLLDGIVGLVLVNLTAPESYIYKK